MPVPNRPSTPLVLYRSPLSGHAHRAELFLSLLGLPYRLVDVDLRGGEHKREPFLKLNPFGQVPVLDDAGTVIADSNAILVYLAMCYDDGRWLPRDPVAAAGVQRWLSVAAGEIAFGPATARLATLFGAPVHADDAIARASRLFALIDLLLQAQPFLTGGHPTLADVAAYSYIARAEEGNVPLAPYPALNAWLRRIEALPGFVPMPVSRVGLAA
ncbi:glutathione S-transferase family protein [Cupriavidus sp. IDO]|uniref:glutathione S-transferase family protein n=1 Tax=Cupriavidus sp. IDO TaxID=1539142 RepID=UPI00057967BC|nr:glutathione S-transferase [Cupriavidus sp. IDO]KWR90634.1 glutathione S-transferase [Cupriavidus sp. IDO]